jgi:peptide/nickel transport system permease protein
MSTLQTAAADARSSSEPVVGEPAPRTRWSEQAGVRVYARRLVQTPLARLALVIVGALVLMAVLADVLAPYDPIKQNLNRSLEAPSADHWLGTDELGRDVLTRVLYGARISLQVGVLAVGFALLLGTLLGLLAGYLPGTPLDHVVMRCMDALLAFPAVVLALAITALLGADVRNAMLAIGIVGVPIFARLVRGQVLAVRRLDFVEAAREIGASHQRIILSHILPNIVSAVIVLASLRIAQAILVEATLSFLGMGVQPPTPTWGIMLSNGRAILQMAPWVALAPGAALFLAVLGFNLLGDAIRDALDPRLRV